MGWNIVPFGMIGTTGQNTVANINSDTFNGLPVVGPNPTAPTVSIGGAAGTGATVSVIGSNLAGIITFASGTGILSTGALFTLTFGGGFSFPNQCVVSLDANNTAASNITPYITTTSSTFTVSDTTLIGSSITSKWMYVCVGW